MHAGIHCKKKERTQAEVFKNSVLRKITGTRREVVTCLISEISNCPQRQTEASFKVHFQSD
jgi:hypothetical protein